LNKLKDMEREKLQKDLREANDKILELRKLLYQVEVYMEQENMNDDYDGIWRNSDEEILEQVKANSLS